MVKISGISACKGTAVGKVHHYSKEIIEITDKLTSDAFKELNFFKNAVERTDEQLKKLYDITLENFGSDEADIFEMLRFMLSDEDFTDSIKTKINEGKNALKAVNEACDEYSVFFENIDDTFMQTRANDVRDVSKLLLEMLADIPDGEPLKEPSVIVAEDLTPYDIVLMGKDNILAFVTGRGIVNSNITILARSLGVPLVVQAYNILSEIMPDMIVAVDGYVGDVFLTPDEATILKLEEKQKNEKGFKSECEAVRGLSSVTKSGKKINVYANTGGNEDLLSVLENDAEGIGVFRTEFLFLGYNSPPSEEMQFSVYKNVAETMKGKKVVIRTMDIGADKQAVYLGVTEEENPALGLRAIRISLERPKLFQTQLRAICRASAFGDISIMFPMISSIWEIKECKKALKEAQDSLKKEKIPFNEIEIGIMIETPASVIMRDEFAKEVDFFSVGTNDLTQFTLAVDRQNRNLMRYADPHHPAVLEMLRLIAESAVNLGIRAGICGDLAADLTLTERFIEMGYTELSVASEMILPLRKTIREIS